jgi:Undecaprenyl-phosphate glucose phosphotransferase
MLKRHAQFFEGLFTASDLLVTSVAWIASYWIRFHSGIIPIDKGIPNLADYLKVLIFVWVVWAFVFRRFGLYRPMRGASRWREIWAVTKANSLAVLLFLALMYLFREKSTEFSRLVFLIFWGLSTGFLLVSRTAIRELLSQARMRGYNLRYALVVGTGELAAKVVSRIRMQPEFGYEFEGCLASGDSLAPDKEFKPHTIMVRPQGENAIPMRIVGTYEDLPKFLERGGVDLVVVALPLADHSKLAWVVDQLSDSIVDVKIVPDFHQFIQLGSLIEEFDGLPVVSLASTPLIGINRVTKRTCDLILGGFIFALTLPLMLISALLVKLTSAGPIFYSQERMGLDGKVFKIYKFRTMYTNAESRGAQMTVEDDPRVTPVGKILRHLNIDEIPQLLNVIRGEMSLVGPRPERPVFIQDFRRKIPKYMLRHKVQAGMTGWAQVNGWRGNTSIERRIEHDLYYIEHWSLFFDLKILGLTLFRGFRDRNAY